MNNCYHLKDSIAAICTPPGEGGVAIIRICGPKAIEVADKVFSKDVPSFKTHTVHYGRFVDPQNQTVDDGLVIVMLGSRSYSGEDTVELHCHGGSIVSQMILELVLAAGARAAQPGEFTFRSFMNGKLDLAQAEAVQEVIKAKSHLAAASSTDQLQGQLSNKVATFQKELTELAAILEAWVDFPEEGLEFTTMDKLLERLAHVRKEMVRLRDTFHDGRLLFDGLSLALIGEPNVGKSSLMNALLDKERAIVTHIAGTTRDVLEDSLRIGGLHVCLTDTAGIRETDEVIEREGIERSKKAMQDADLVLLVLDTSKPISPLVNQIPADKTLIVWNKVDLAPPQTLAFPHVARVSALDGTGIEELKDKIHQRAFDKGLPDRGEVLITSLRHKEALTSAIESCDRTIDALKNNTSPEFVCLELKEALYSLGQIIGTDVTEDILSSIFSKFCIGK